MGKRDQILNILNSLVEEYVRKYYTVYAFDFFAIDVMGSVARGKENPRDLDVCFIITSEVGVRNEERIWSFLEELENKLREINVGLDHSVLNVEELERRLRLLADSVESFLKELDSTGDVVIDTMNVHYASAILHVVKAVDIKVASLLYSIYLVNGLHVVPWHNMWIHGKERVKQLVEPYIDNIMKSVCRYIMENMCRGYT